MRHLQKRSPRGIRHLVSRVSNKLQPIIAKAQSLLEGHTRLKKGKGPFTGVAQGIGEYFEINPVFIRIGFALGAVLSWWTILAYGILAFFLPQNDSKSFPFEDEGEGYEDEVEPRFVDLRICEYCNTAVKPRAKFCHHCGAKLETQPRVPLD